MISAPTRHPRRLSADADSARSTGGSIAPGIASNDPEGASVLDTGESASTFTGHSPRGRLKSFLQSPLRSFRGRSTR